MDGDKTVNELFIDSDGKSYGAEDIRQSLLDIGADDCDTLFIHSDVMFGKPPTGFRRQEYLRILYQIIEDLGVRNIIVPTFTYSFCNHEDYDVLNSKTSMGAFNDYIRKQNGRYRTLDPLLSLSVPEKLKNRFENVSNHSLGKDSGLDIIHRMDGVKFLFFGTKQGECFTYLHYIEKIAGVPYRFDMPFSGNIKGYNGNVFRKEQYMHTHCYGVKIPPNYNYFENELMDKGLVKKRRLGNSSVSCLKEVDAYEQILNKISYDPYYFVEGTYSDKDLIHKYSFGLNGERVTHC